MNKMLFFDAEDFMWADGKPLSPSEAAMQANKMFNKWYLDELEDKIKFLKSITDEPKKEEN